MSDSDLATGNAMSQAVFEIAEKENSAAVRVSAQVGIERDVAIIIMLLQIVAHHCYMSH